MYQKRHYGNSGVKTTNNSYYGHSQPDQSRFNKSYTQLQFENSLGKVMVCTNNYILRKSFNCLMNINYNFIELYL